MASNVFVRTRVWFSAAERRGLIEAANAARVHRLGPQFSAAERRGLIEASPYQFSALSTYTFSAAERRGLIEANGFIRREIAAGRFPRQNAAASLKPGPRRRRVRAHDVFRGRTPRPH